MAILTAALGPELIGTFADSLFKVPHLTHSVQGPRPDVNENAGARYAVGFLRFHRSRMQFDS
jgi:hypothetical protein